jgi:hypothetical protein
MLFEQEKIDLINDGLSRLSYFYNGLTDKEDDVIIFSSTLKQLFIDFKNKSKFKNENNLNFLGSICDWIIDFEYSINKDIVWRKEGIEEELQNFGSFHDEYIDAYNIAREIESFLQKAYPHKYITVDPENDFVLFEPINFDRTEQIQTKSEKFYQKLSEHGFFDLDKVKSLSKSSQKNLFEIVSNKGIGYKIAMFDFVGFLNHLEREYFPSKNVLQKQISSWLESDKDGRTVRGHMNALVKQPDSNDRYKSYIYKEQVRKHYESLQ